MLLPLYEVNAFTDRPFAGNPAAVVPLDTPKPEAFLQALARELNLSETAYLLRENGEYHLRWFTPKVEVDLCGHATLATAHVVWEQGWLPGEAEVRVLTRSGVLTARRQDSWITLDFPSQPAERCPPLKGLLEALDVEAVQVATNGEKWLVEVQTEEILRQLQPDFRRLGQLGVSVIVTSRSAHPGYDFVSRFFAPVVGIDEDPVTGTAHCCLAPYWQQQLHKDEMIGYQASTRGGVVKVAVVGDRVLLSGQAVTVWKGELLVEE